MQEESILREQIVRVGRLSAKERIGHLLLELLRRMNASLGRTQDRSFISGECVSSFGMDSLVSAISFSLELRMISSPVYRRSFCIGIVYPGPKQIFWVSR